MRIVARDESVRTDGPLPSPTLAFNGSHGCPGRAARVADTFVHASTNLINIPPLRAHRGNRSD